MIERPGSIATTGTGMPSARALGRDDAAKSAAISSIGVGSSAAV